MTRKWLPFVAALVCLTLFGLAETSAAQSQPQVIDDSQLKALSTTIGGATVLPTTRTVPHWFGSTLDPDNGITYGYNMVGADPNNCSGAACSVTVEADITPIIVNVGGFTFSGSDIVAATLASPEFALNNYGSTPGRNRSWRISQCPRPYHGSGRRPLAG
jgi:hypothetical protein